MACAHNMMMKLKHISEQEEREEKNHQKNFADEYYGLLLLFVFVFVTLKKR